jgi:hypothetical protein
MGWRSAKIYAICSSQKGIDIQRSGFSARMMHSSIGASDLAQELHPSKFKSVRAPYMPGHGPQFPIFPAKMPLPNPVQEIGIGL